MTGESTKLGERLAVLGSGAIACGLARLAGPLGEVRLWARSEESAARARDLAGDAVTVVTDLEELAGSSFVLEAIVEDEQHKRALYERIAPVLSGDAVLATTTSSLSVTGLAAASGRPGRFAGVHLFNPVERMSLVELAFPPEADPATKERGHALCAALGKTAVEVPDIPGFVVNRLLFPYLFAAVAMLDHDLSAEDVDACMTLGAGHPLGPLALLDLIGLDVSAAIGESVGAEVPERLTALMAEGRLGRKTGRGFHDYA